ncbi:hypothetical protein ACET3Z_008075 [Daucus carota]
MEGKRRKETKGIEENTLAILDTSGFGRKEISVAQHVQNLNDDRLAFLEAVRTASLVSENGTAPTSKMYQAIFQILREESSLDSIMSSYQLLKELDTRFPRVYISEKTETESASASTSPFEIVVVEDAWSPFIFGVDCPFTEKDASREKPPGSLDPSGFHLLIKDLSEMDNEGSTEESQTKLLRTMLTFQYLVYVLEGDFLPRNRAYKEKMNWSLLRESFLSKVLGSRRLPCKALIKDCISVMCMCHVRCGTADDLLLSENSSKDKLESCRSPATIALPEIEKCLCTAMQKLLLMIMELDALKETADMQGLTTRADGPRTPVPEIILDELSYNRDMLSPFLQAFHEPRWKLEIVMQYIRKYVAKPSVRTRRSNGSANDATFPDILKGFGNGSSTKSILKKISAEVAQLLLAHAFQAYLSLSLRDPSAGLHDSEENVGDCSLAEVCKSMIAAFSSLKKTNEHITILPFGKEALFTAATILSTQ